MDKKSNEQILHANYVFGPVPSRRLGRSLGIDLVPLKTCTYDCIYCQLGRTTNQTLERKPYVSGKLVIKQLQEKLPALAAPPDYITFSGSGEPTLNPDIGGVIKEIKKLTEIPIAVLTNGSLLHLEPVRRALLSADLIIPSLDAASPALFRFIDRPHHSLHLSQTLQGLREFRREYSGQIWLEVMLCGGMNDEPKEIKRLREEIEKIGPDRIQLNTVVRPPAEEFAYPLSPERLEEIRALFAGRAEILPQACPAQPGKVYGKIDHEILSLLERRPCSFEDLSLAFGISGDKLGNCLKKLRNIGAIDFYVHNHTVFYKALRKAEKDCTIARRSNHAHL
ncbi:MAG: radical SAM protein [Proteobacteria bacterium]|nr:radical SAM protein [Pseudomonadota bacterium]